MISLGRRSCQLAAGQQKLTTRHLHGGSGAMGGAFWGFLFGLIIFVPFLGAAIGAAMGAGSMADVGIRAGVAQAAESQRFIAPIAASSSPCPSPSRNSRPRRRAQEPLVALVD